jgi:hypothetical protein
MESMRRSLDQSSQKMPQTMAPLHARHKLQPTCEHAHAYMIILLDSQVHTLVIFIEMMRSTMILF